VTTTGIQRTFERGDTWAFTVQVYSANANLGVFSPYTWSPTPLYPQSPRPATGPLNITGWSAYCTVKYQTTDPDSVPPAIWQATSLVSGGIMYPQPTIGLLSVQVPPSATYQLADGTETVYYDVQLVDSSGNVWTVESGTIAVPSDVTRAIVAPSGAGAVPFAAQGTSNVAVPNLATLGTASTAGLASGSLAWVPNASGSGAGTFFVLNHVSTLSPNGTTVVAAAPAGSGNWEKLDLTFG
jgi:hypothetical protein